jgi:hypothetical protein
MGWIGERNMRLIGNPPISARTLGLVASLIGVSALGYLLYRRRTKSRDSKEKLLPQGNAASSMRPPDPTSDRENVWYKEQFELTPFDVTPTVVSYKAYDRDGLVKILEGNCARIKTYSVSEGKTSHSKMFCVGGHWWLAVKHCLPSDPEFDLTIVQSSQRDSIVPNCVIRVDKSMMREVAPEIVLIILKNVPPKKDIREIIAKNSVFGSYHGFYLDRGDDDCRE